MTDESGVAPQYQVDPEPDSGVETGDNASEAGGPVIAPPGTTRGSYSVCGRCYGVVANLELHHEAVHVPATTTTAEEAS